jgi:hypothetical protein
VRKTILGLLAAATTAGTLAVASPALATSQARPLNIPGGQGTVTSNAWRTTGNGSISGNTRQWEYQVSAVYAGINGSDVSVGSGSSWDNISTNPKYWENSNGTKSSSWRSNIIVAPQQYYLKDTIYIANTALVKLSSDTRTFQITASA